MNENKPEKKKLKKPVKIILIVASVILALVLLASAALLIFGKSLLSLIPRLDPNQQSMSQEEIDALLSETDPLDPNFDGPYYDDGELEIPDEAELLASNKDIIHIMLVGQDRRSGQYRQRSDAMILCTINKKTKTLTMTSFMRDLWAYIPGYYYERLNVPYAIEGFDLLNKTMEYQFGVHADYNVEVDFSGFKTVIDALGGVHLQLTSAEAYSLNKKTDWGLTEGYNLLTGEQALAYSRTRNIDSDFNRTNRQRTVLNAVFKQMQDKSATEIYNLVTKMLPMVTTDMKDSDILSLIWNIAPILSELEVVSQRIPIDDAYTMANIGGRSVIVLKPDQLKKNRAFLKHTLGE